MKELKEYVCKKCGGALIVERSQMIGKCPFCGSEFVHDGPNELLHEAFVSLRRREYVDAKAKLDMCLSKDPGNVRALLGQIFCEGEVSSVEQLSSIDKLSRCNLTGLKDKLDETIECVPDEQKEYFTVLQELVKTADKYKRISVKHRELEKESEAQYEKIMDTYEDEVTREKYYDEKWYQFDIDTEYYKKCVVISILVIVISFFVAFLKINYIYMLVGLAITAIVIVCTVLAIRSHHRKFENKRAPYRRKVSSLRNMSSEYSRQIMRAKNYYAREYQEWKKLDESLATDSITGEGEN